MEKGAPATQLLKMAEEAPQKKFPALSIFRTDLWSWLKDYSQSAFGKPAPFPVPDAQSIVPIADNTNIAVLGDWGTGTDEAAIIAELVNAKPPEYTIHIGDVYYVGSEEFIAENCLGQKQPNGYDPVIWPPGTKRSFAMNGNHEAYARDGAYFKWIKESLGQQSSCFLLHNNHWCILGLDTGYNSEGIPWLGWVAEHFGWKWLMPSCKLPEEAVSWLRTFVQPLLAGKGLVLLTHHQPSSAFEQEYDNAAAQLAAIPGFTNRTILWLWGHEHRLAVYDPFTVDKVKFYGRCLGHSGMPVDRGVEPDSDRADRNLLFYDDRSYDPEKETIVRDPDASQTAFGVNGYATLAGATATISYVDISGEEIASDVWSLNGESVQQVGQTTFGKTVRLDGNRLVAVPAARPAAMQ